MGTDPKSLPEITLDEFGRAVLSDDDLKDVEAHLGAPSAGGLNGGCHYSSNGDCFNTYCRGSSNNECTNQTDCGGASNRFCVQYPV
jgi:hypothetical protein